MLHLKVYNAATGEKIYDHLYQSLNEADVTCLTAPQIVASIADDHGIEPDMVAWDCKEL